RRLASALELRPPARPGDRTRPIPPGPGESRGRDRGTLRAGEDRSVSPRARAGERTREAPAEPEALRRGPPAPVSALDRSTMTPGLVDSHCHLDFPEFEGKLDEVREEMRANGVTHALCISVELPKFPKVLALAESHDNFFASVGVHPDHEAESVEAARLVELARNPKVVAIGETGLDYHRLSGDLEWQRERVRIHIRAARECGKPLVIHTRDAAEDTLRIMREERAREVGGVMHCFAETADVAAAALALGFHISFSGIVTFKNAGHLRDIAKAVPLDRL